MSSLTQLDGQLARVEAALDKVESALKSSEAEGLQRASEQLRDAAVRFSQLMESDPAGALAPSIAVRMRTVGVRLAGQRDALARLGAAVDRQVATVLPEQAPASTYGPKSSARGAGVARIYKSTS